MSGITLDFETADRITIANMKEHLAYLKEEVRLHVEEGKYLNPEDYRDSVLKFIPALELLIPYYGGQL